MTSILFRRLVRATCIAVLCWSAAAVRAEEAATVQIVPAPELPASLPWDLAVLSRPPVFEWLDETSPVRSLLYAGEPFEGHATRVFAYYATPASIGGGSDAGQAAAATTKGPWPGIVLVHGGGGTAFAEWVTLWAKRGYAAIAMDLAGCRPDPAGTKKNAVVRMPDGGPGQDHKDKFDTIATPETSDDWPYHAVANVIRAHSLLRRLPGVDPTRTAITGISWGGYTTCLVASLDSRFRAAVPVYGCGHLSAGLPRADLLCERHQRLRLPARQPYEEPCRRAACGEERSHRGEHAARPRGGLGAERNCRLHRRHAAHHARPAGGRRADCR